jgi:hypothetical protein
VSTRLLAGGVLVAASAIIALQIYLIVDLRAFEYPYLTELLGLRGLVFLAFLQLGGIVAVIHAWCAIRRVSLSPRVLTVSRYVLIAWVILFGWFADWMLLETPITVRVRDAIAPPTETAIAVDTALEYADRIGTFPQIEDSDRQRRLAVMIARIVINKPQVFRRTPLVETLVRYGAKYDVDPTLTFALAYLDSFYGEAVSGPMPFFAQISGETFRDLVQIHLPSWFIESPIRVELIEDDWLERVFGAKFGRKLRYALQKANYDVSSDPFDTNVFSDLFLVLREYESEFPELTSATNTSPIDVAFRESFDKLRDVTLLRPYDQPLAAAPSNERYYDTYRVSLITFGRAAYYKLILDFDFATRVQTLVARYYLDQYREILGDDVWKDIQQSEKLALVAMLRDVYVPNIGKLGYNLYILPELNCTPIQFVAAEARKHPSELLDKNTVWRPQHSEDLWAGAGYKIRSLAEVWAALKDTKLPGQPATDTIDDAIEVIARNRSRLL